MAPPAQSGSPSEARRLFYNLIGAGNLHWYFAINEAGSAEGIGLHSKLAVLSAMKVGGLEPHLIYFGTANEYTSWMERHGVTITITSPINIIELTRASSRGGYPQAQFGHWLRASVPWLEKNDQFVLYTDCDVYFRRRIDFSDLKPKSVACAPEFKPDNWGYFNSGVMIMNTERGRADGKKFSNYVDRMLKGPESARFNDQWAYNEFYAKDWERLPITLNWKPYWGFNPNAEIVHWHGPKLSTIKTLLSGSYPWNNRHDIQVGSIALYYLARYVGWLEDLAKLLEKSEYEAYLHDLRMRAGALSCLAPIELMDLSMMQVTNFRGER